MTILLLGQFICDNLTWMCIISFLNIFFSVTFSGNDCINYTQTFCFRQLYDIVLKKKLNIPILTIEGDRPGEIDRRTALRLDAFVEMIRGG